MKIYIPIIFEQEVLQRKWICSTLPFEGLKVGDTVNLLAADDSVLDSGIITKLEMPGTDHGYPQLRQWYKAFYTNSVSSGESPGGSSPNRTDS